MTEIGIILALLVVAMGDNRISMNGTSTIAGGPDHCPPQKRDTRVVDAWTHSSYDPNDRDDLVLARLSQQIHVMSYFSQHNDDNGDDAEDLSGPEPTGRDCLVRAILNEARHGLQLDRSARAITVTVGRHLNSGTLDVVLPADAAYYDPRSFTTVTVSDASRHAPAAADSATVAARLAAAYGDAPRVEL